MYHFISGYTAKIAGTELGINEPQATFSACFGAAFLPLHPGKYAEMLGKKMNDHKVNVWLVNTGWSGGPHGTGQRTKLSYTRSMISAALEGHLDHVAYHKHPVFGVSIPESCNGVPSEILNPRDTWANPHDYDAMANHLAGLFNNNFEKYVSGVSEEIIAAAPKSQESSQ
jgi:phosphoenolpyruvate carboxykinase (ATP)